MRITGLATGLDMDEVIKESMRPYRVKIQQQQQQKEIVEIKQKLYRDVLKDSREFYNKYFDVSKSDSIVLSKNWSTIKFESSDTLENNTKAIFNAIANNKKVEILGHLGNPAYKLDYEAIVKKVKEKNIMIEINTSSLLGNSRKGSESNCKQIAELCKKHNAKIIVTSDAHISFSIGQFDKAIEMLESINFPEELIMNDPSKLIAHLKNKGKLTDL